jgi:guanine deaminase
MDRHCPSYYTEPSPESSIVDTEALIAHIRSLPTPSTSPSLVQPILTPRFAISCSPTLLTSLGNLASSDPSIHIQTHISENLSEISYTKSLFPHCASYADVYNYYGLLRENTILAHGVHLGEDELELIKDKGAGISHCPTSNFNLCSGVARVGEFLDRGIKARTISLH